MPPGSCVIFLGFAAGRPTVSPARSGKICAGFFEAFSRGLFAPDVYAKRVASRILMQYATLARGDAVHCRPPCSGSAVFLFSGPAFGR